MKVLSRAVLSTILSPSTSTQEALEDYFGGKNIAEIVAAAVCQNLPVIPPSNAAEIAGLKAKVAMLTAGLEAIGKKVVGEDFPEVGVVWF